MNRLPYTLLFISIILNVFSLADPWGLTGNHVLSIFSILLAGAGIWMIYKSSNRIQTADVEQQGTSLASTDDHLTVKLEQEKFLQSLSHQRHDWLNHFQVLLGYLKLQRYDVCEEYIKKVTENTNNDSKIAGLGYQPLVAYLLTFNALHKELILEVELPSLVDLRPLPEENKNQIYALVKGLADTYLRNAQAEYGQANTLLVLIQMLDQSLYVSVEFEGDLDDQGCLQGIYQLVEKFGNEEGFFVEGLHNNRESIMEFYLPLSNASVEAISNR